jgi:hypothetical protein
MISLFKNINNGQKLFVMNIVVNINKKRFYENENQ